jgi:CheY-like chemotaxis protein
MAKSATRPYILYIEDDQLETMRFKIALNQNQFTGEVRMAENGEEGLNMLNAQRHHLPNIIVLDLQMPKMNGFEFLKEVKNDITLRRIPIIILTTSKNEKDILQSYDFQVAGFFTKPFSTLEYNKIVKCIKDYWEVSKTISL